MDKNKQIAENLRQMFPQLLAQPRYGNQIEVRVSPGQYSAVINHLKAGGFSHLVNMTCVDWIEKKQFDVTCNLWSYTDKIHITLKAGINRDEPKLVSIHMVWPHAQVYEREIHEMFGVVFSGNPNLSPLFLHNWQDIPPLRKDFDTEEYAKMNFEVEKFNDR